MRTSANGSRMRAGGGGIRVSRRNGEMISSSFPARPSAPIGARPWLRRAARREWTKRRRAEGAAFRSARSHIGVWTRAEARRAGCGHKKRRRARAGTTPFLRNDRRASRRFIRFSTRTARSNAARSDAAPISAPRGRDSSALSGRADRAACSIPPCSSASADPLT